MNKKWNVKKYYLIPFIIFLIIYLFFQLFNIKITKNNNISENEKIRQEIINNKDKWLSTDFRHYWLWLAWIVKDNKEIFLRDLDNKIVKFEGWIEIKCKLNSKECIELLKGSENNLKLINPNLTLNQDKYIQLLILSWLNQDNNKIYIDIYWKINNNDKYKFLITKEDISQH